MKNEIIKAAHSELGASSYDRWKNCPGSVALCRDLPKKTSVYAEEGTMAHDVAAKALEGFELQSVSEEMWEAVNVYLAHINSVREQGPSFEAIEQKLDLSEYHHKLFGTADYVCYFADTKVLHVIDYKHGAGVAVEVNENEQLMYYGLGALHANKFPIKKIVLTIVQPRCYHEKGPVRSWETDAMTMLEYSAQLIADAEATEKADAPLQTGDHCRWCNAQGVCPKMHSKAIATAQNVFGNTVNYDPMKLSETLMALDQIEAWAKSVRSFAYSEAEAGRIPPGFKLVDKRAMRKWKDDADFGTLPLHENDMYERKLKSPASIEKMLEKSAKPLIEALTVKESSGKNLVPENDTRQSIAPKIKDVFDVI